MFKEVLCVGIDVGRVFDFFFEDVFVDFYWWFVILEGCVVI